MNPDQKINYPSVAMGDGPEEQILTAARQARFGLGNDISFYQCLSVFICGFNESSEQLR
jgi:hypothetical protein